MADTPRVKNSSLKSRKEAKTTATPTGFNLGDETPVEGQRSRHRRRPERRRSSRNSEIQETDISTRGARGQTSDSHNHLEATTDPKRGDGPVTPAALQPSRLHLAAPGIGTSGISTRSRHSKAEQVHAPHLGERSLVVTTGAKNHAGSLSPVEKQAPHSHLGTPGTGSSDFLTTSRHCKERKSSASNPTKGSDAMTASAKSHEGSVSPVARQTPRPRAEAQDTDTSGIRTGAQHDKVQMLHSTGSAESSAAGTTSPGPCSSYGSPHPIQTSQLNLDSPGTRITSLQPGSSDGNVGASDSALSVAEPPVRTRPSTPEPVYPVTTEEGRILDPHNEAVPDAVSSPAVLSSHHEGTYPSPGAVKAFQETQAHRLDYPTLSTSPTSESKPSTVLPWRKKSVRFGGTTLLEFVPLTSISEKITHARVIYAILGAIAALTCAGVVFMVWTTNPNHRQSECGSVECQNAQAYLDHFLDKTVDPCRDFSRHVCHRWIVQNVDGATMVEKAARDLIGSLHISLLERETRHAATWEAERPLASFYDSCRQFVASTHNVRRRRFITANRGDIDILQLTSTPAALQQVVLLSLQRGISTVLSFKVVLHGEGGLALYVSRGKTLTDKLGDASDSSTLINYIREALLLISKIRGSVRKSVIRTTVRDLLAFDSETSSAEEGLPIAKTLNASEFAVFMQETNPRDWLTFVNSILRGNLTLYEYSPVMIPRLDLVEAAVKYLAKNFKIGLMYILLHIIAEVGRFYYRSTFSNKAEVLCLTASQEVMGPSWRTFFSSLTRSLLPTRSRVRNIFYSLRRLSSQHFVEYGMDEADKKNALAALRGITLLVDYDPLPPESTQLDSFAIDHLNPADSFPLNYTSLKALEAERRLQEPPSLTEVLIDESFLTPKTTYSRLLNAILLPPAVRQPPLMYSTSVPLEFDMGTVGVLLAKELFQASLPSARSGNTWYKENVERFVECVQRALMRNASMSFQQGLELFSWARAVKVAHTVVMLMYSSNKENDDFGKVWSAAQQTFFRRFCLMACSAASTGFDSRIRCLVPLLNMIEFESAFECGSSQEASLKHCAIFLGYL